ncbi:MAG: HetP family heterocyst commitment protein [Xenococcaceae cyanobacterium]
MSQHLVHSQIQGDKVEAGYAVAGRNPLDKVTDSSKFNLVVEAIIAGKYSWACVLMLRFAGYNPLLYIPYRTYNRLMKKNSQQSTLDPRQKHGLKEEQKSLAVQPSYQIDDLSYLETISQQDKEINGGKRVYLSYDSLNELEDTISSRVKLFLLENVPA